VKHVGKNVESVRSSRVVHALNLFDKKILTFIVTTI